MKNSANATRGETFPTLWSIWKETVSDQASQEEEQKDKRAS
jgi:hypothetical protein